MRNRLLFKSSATIHRRMAAAGVAFLVFLGGFAGCRSSGKKSPIELPTGALAAVENPVLLHGETIKLLEEIYADIIGTASTIASQTQDRRMRENTLRWKIRTLGAIQLIASEQDPRRQFVLAWVAAAQFLFNVTEGPHRDIYSDHQKVVVDLANEFERKVLDIGYRHFDKEVVDAAREEVEALARNLPLTGHLGHDLVAVGDIQKSTATNDLTKLMQTPFAAFTGLQGVADTPTAIREFTGVAGGFSDVVRLLPRHARWEAELLLLELDSLETVVEMRRNLERASESMESLSKTAEAFMAGETQEEFQATVAEIRKAVEEVKGAIQQLENAAKTAEETTRAATEAGAQWEATAKAVQGVLAAYRELAGPGEEEPAAQTAEEKPSAAQEWAHMAEEIRLAGNELSSLINDLEAGKLKRVLADLGETSQLSVDHAADRLQGLVDRLLLGALILAAGILAASLLIRAVAKRRRP